MGEKSPIDIERSAAEPNVEQEQRLSSHHTEISQNGDAPTSNDASTDDGNVQYPSGTKIALIVISNFLAIFLVALVSPETTLDLISNFAQDRTIIETAIP